MKILQRLYTLTYVINYPSDHIFRPGQINEKLANDIRITIPQDYLKLESEENQAHHKGFLHPRDLRGVTKKLESQGIFIHLEGKEEIRRQEHARHVVQVKRVHLMKFMMIMEESNLLTK